MLRWEYRRGSTLYLVWSQNRRAWEEWGAGGSRVGMLGGAFTDPAEHMLMLKVSYWFSP
ncbi:MAG: hypothetical protein ACOC0J_01815 [Myxococcota bacterium]